MTSHRHWVRMRPVSPRTTMLTCSSARWLCTVLPRTVATSTQAACSAATPASSTCPLATTATIPPIGYLGPGELSGVANDGFWGNLIAHEAGHLFGLQHSLTQAPGGSVSPLIPTSEIMSYLGANGYNFFSRYPQVRGNNNTMNNDDLQAVSPPAPAAQRTPHDQWLNTASIGQNTDFHYVTGTGANDIITITNAGGGNATVSVQAFSDGAYADRAQPSLVPPAHQPPTRTRSRSTAPSPSTAAT